MAATHISPTPADDRIEDPVTYKEASALLARTGHGVSDITVARWVRNANQAGRNIRVERRHRTDHVSWSDVLDLHYESTSVKLRASSNWP